MATRKPGAIARSSSRRIGIVRHYYPRAGAAVVEVTAGALQTGDTVHFRGHTTDYYQRLDRLEVDHEPVEVANAGQTVGVHVSQRVREGDEVLVID